MFRTVLILGLLTVSFALARQSRADSDGYFCTSKGYLAYDLRQGITSGVVGHVLRVVRFDSSRGIYLAGEVKLLDFEVYHLICNPDHIKISGWGTMFTKYTIEIERSGDLRSVGPINYPGREWSEAAKDGPAPTSLRYFGPHVTPLPLESLDPDHKYQLLRNRSSKTVNEGLEERSKSELIQLDPRGRVLQRFTLYESRIVESPD